MDFNFKQTPYKTIYEKYEDVKEGSGSLLEKAACSQHTTLEKIYNELSFIYQEVKEENKCSLALDTIYIILGEVEDDILNGFTIKK